MASIEVFLTLKKFQNKGEKTGWTYLDIPVELANQLKPNQRKSFRVKGFLDAVAIERAALLPMGEGEFILPVKADLLRKLRKEAGTEVLVKLDYDESPHLFDPEFEACLQDSPEALAYFSSLSPSHQRYFDKWIAEAKTQATREKRLVEVLVALSRNWDFGQMLRARKQNNDHASY